MRLDAMCIAQRLIVVSVLAAAGVTPCLAQDTTSRAAVVIRAEVSAREIRFAAQPVVRVNLAHGTVDSVRVIERRNLPQPVRAGQTYRDVYIAVEIVGRINAECLSARITRRELPACTTARDTTSRRSP